MRIAESIYPSKAQRSVNPVTKFYVQKIGEGWLYLPWVDVIGDDCRFFQTLEDLMIYAIAQAKDPVH